MRKSLKNGADCQNRTDHLLITNSVTADDVSHGSAKEDCSPNRCVFDPAKAVFDRLPADFARLFATDHSDGATHD